MIEIITNVSVGKYLFRIIDNSNIDDNGMIYGRNFKIGGTYNDCVNVSIKYDENGNPLSAKIPTLVYVPRCSLSVPLGRGDGSILIIKTLLRHVNNVLPTITKFEFEDISKIECATKEELESKQYKYRKEGTHAIPVSLYYFSIAFNGITWYEKHFNAYYKSKDDYKIYREKVEMFLTNEKMMPFHIFIRIANPSEKIKEELKVFYEKANSYGEFFQSIPYEDRCRLVRGWITSFMEDRLKGIFFNNDWIIDITKMDNNENKIQKAGKRKNREVRKNKKVNYYCPMNAICLSDKLCDVGADMNQK